MKYRFLPHTADIMIQAAGRTRGEMFANAARALKETICGNIAVRPRLTRTIRVRGDDLETVLCGFLEEFLYLLDAEQFLPAEVGSVAVKGGELTAKVRGDNADRYVFSNSVKAVTYSEMFVRRRGSGWLAQFVLDV